ncbi:hypothetical protein LJK88_07070 [Paenibacillus sp. P26]|nr:hypothetical protein LJK88_07070 [Paenibacillus sp. P26]
MKDVILQLFFALTPFIFFNIYYRDKIRNYSRSFILISSSICLLLSMSFASSVVGGIIFDVRYVILFFALVYGGIETALILLAEFVIYRVYLGGQGLWAGLTIMAVSFAVSIIFLKAFKNSRRPPLATFVAGIVFSTIPLVITYFFFPISLQGIWLFILS